MMHLKWRYLFVFLAVLLVACTTSAPIVAPTAASIAIAPTITLPPPITPTTPPTLAVEATARPLDTPAVTYTPSPLPVGRAIRPNEIEVSSTPNRPTADPANIAVALGTIEWRPPPMSVPVSIHPDDHYWFIRPLPSGTRNYALEWYPYGNDVLIPQYAPYRIHHGLDFPNRDGTQVLAASSGTVVWAGPRPSSRDGVNYYGNTIIIKHDWQWRGQDVYTLYAHTIEMFVQVGDYVQQGQLLAGVGGTGFTSGPHLHFEVRIGENQYYATRNPHLWLAPFEGWGTLAGRFVDSRGEFISGADLVVTPLRVEVDTSIRVQKTYEDRRLIPDELWNENFVVGDLPAGRYRLELSITTTDDGLTRTYTNVVDVRPGRTNFVIVQADFVFVPTPTPLPSPTITGTLSISNTNTLNESVGSFVTPTAEPSE